VKPQEVHVDFEEAMRIFARHLASEKGRSPETVRAYLSDLRDFRRYLDSWDHVERVTGSGRVSRSRLPRGAIRQDQEDIYRAEAGCDKDLLSIPDEGTCHIKQSCRRDQGPEEGKAASSGNDRRRSQPFLSAQRGHDKA